MLNSDNDTVISGLTLKQWVGLLNGDKQVDAVKAINYFQGQQEAEVQKVLEDPNRGRANWKTRGLYPRFRNVTRMIVEKSGLLFKDTAPVLEIYDAGATNPNKAATTVLANELAKLEWDEFTANLDQLTRLLKTTVVLVQWDSDNKQLCLDYLHRGNCEVQIDPKTRKPTAMIHFIGQDPNGNAQYRVWTPNDVTMLTVQPNGSITAGAPAPNPYQIIPIAQFYDTTTPLAGFWVEQDKSVVNLNEMVNLHLTDSEYSVLWQKMSTPVTNMRPAGGTDYEQVQVQEVYGQALPRAVAAQDQDVAGIGGPGQAIVLDSMGIENPFFEYKNPNIPLADIEQVVNTWIQNTAGDWCVRVHLQGEAKANSGFQLIVEEMANLDLRKSRQRMFTNSFKRLYRVMARVLNIAYNRNVLDEQAQMFAKFNLPGLPVDTKEQEEIWSMKIQEGRATELDYFMTVEGMTHDEAMDKWQQICEFNKTKAAMGLAMVPTTSDFYSQQPSDGQEPDADDSPSSTPTQGDSGTK